MSSLIKEFQQLYDRYAHDTRLSKLLKEDGIAPDQLDVGLCSHSFFQNKLADISTDANANLVNDISPTSYRSHITNGPLKLLGYHLLWYHYMKRFGREAADEAISMVWDGDLYFHDAHGAKIQMPYCYAFSLDKVVYDGRPYGPSPNKPPKRRKSFLSQVDKLIADLSRQFAGATAPSDFFLWYAYFCQLEGIDIMDPDDIYEIQQDMEGMVCLFNEPGRAEGDPPFTNIAIYDMIGLSKLFSHIIYPDGSKPDLSYIMELQKIFCEWFSHGDPISGFPYSFPVVTINMTTNTHGDFIDTDFAWWAANTNKRMANFNLHFGTEAKMAMCCRYENDLDDMGMTPDSFGNGGVNIGSHRVVTPNYARAAYLSNGDIGKFYKILNRYFEVAANLLLVHRYDILQKRIDKNPDYLRFFGRLKWFNLKTMFSTFGVVGINEAIEILGFDILTESGTSIALDIMQYIRDTVRHYRKLTGVTFNAEEIPGEQACVTLVNKDRIMIHPDIPYHMYSNQYIPLTKEADIVTRIDLSGRFMKMISGGGIVHCNLDAPVDSTGKMYELMKLAAKSGVPHIAICHRFGKCEDHKAVVVGQNQYCPICGKPIVQAKARVIGYFSDEGNWNAVRREHDAPHRFYSDGEELGDE